MALTLTASEAGLEIVDRARKKKGWNKTAESFLTAAGGISRSSLDKFWARKPITHENFVAICKAVEVEWQTVVEQEDRDINNSQPSGANKLDKFNGLKIAKQIHDWLTALRYEFEAHEDFQPKYCEFIIRIPVRRGRFDRIIIRGILSEAKVRDLQTLKASVDKHQADEGWLIVNRRISSAVPQELAKDENQHLSCMTFDELIDQDADFEPYLKWLEEEVIKRGIDRKYVSLACDKEEIDPVTQHSIATSSYGEAEGWIEGYIKQWLSDDSKEHVSILGEFGTGKTWFSFHYAWDCLRAYKQAKEQGLERPRLPLVIALRDYNKALKVESVLSDLFFNKHDIRLNSSVFDCLNQMGKLVIIFDGFDEMADKVDRQKMINNFWELARVVCPGSKVILTSRTEHFPHDRESRQLLNAELESSTAKLKWESPRFELLELAKFNEAQIRHVLTLEAEEKGLSTDIVEKVMVRAELLDLARRPVMTELIIEAMPEIEAGKPVDMSRIYYYAIVHKMDRDIKAERTFTSLADKLYFLCEIAWEMLSTERMKLNYREFPERIRQIFPQLVTEAKDLDHWHYDMMGQTILIRNADGDYTPAHRSLLEFLVAYKFAAEAGVLKADFVEAMQGQKESCIDRDAMPQDYTWTGYLQACVAAKCEGRKIAPLCGFMPESSEYLCDTFGREPLTKAVIDLIVPMLEPTNPKPLLDLIHSTKGKTEQETGWLGGNAATILVDQNRAALDCEDLSYTQMANSNLRGANFHRSTFTGANLKYSIFASISPSNIHAIATSKDSRFFVTGHDDSSVRLWDATTNQLVQTYVGHEDKVNGVAISPDGNWIISASRDLKIKRWQIKTGKCLNTYTGHEDSVTSVSISSDGSWFISGSLDGTIKRWDILASDCLNSHEHQAFIFDVAIAPNDNWFLSAGEDRTIKRWDVDTSKCINSYAEHKSSVRAVAIASDSSWFLSGSDDASIKKWDVNTGACLRTYIGHQGSVWDIAIASDNSWFLSGSDDKTLEKWDVNTGNCSHNFCTTHKNCVFWVIAIAPNQEWFVVGGQVFNLIEQWDAINNRRIHTYYGSINSIRGAAVSSDGNWLIIGSADFGTIKCWDLNTDKCIRIYSGHQNTVWSVAISPDESWLVSGSVDHTIKRWDKLTGECLHTYIGHKDRIWSVGISPDSSWILTCSEDQTIKRWSINTGKCIHTYIGHTDAVNSLAISPDGRWFVSGSRDHTLKRWDINTGECFHTYRGHQGLVRTIAISLDGSWFVSGSDDNMLKRWNIDTGDCLYTCTGHQESVWSVAISPDSSWFASGSTDSTIRRWGSKKGECLHIYNNQHNSGYTVRTSGQDLYVNNNQKDSVFALTLLPDGRQIISCDDEKIRIWDVETGECIRTISNQSCAGMRIGGAIGLTSGQIESLKALGAVDD
jgi:WD40 repeat protein/DNA-binding Xre family transcriptional regulator